MNVNGSKTALRTVLIAAVAAASVCSAQQVRPDPLEMKLIDVPDDLYRVPLASALDRIGFLAQGLVLFGVEIPLDHGNQPLVSAHIPAAVTVREALNIIFEKLPGFTFSSVSQHLITVLPEAYAADHDDMLNLPLPSVEIVNISPSTILNDPERYIPVLHSALFKDQICGLRISASDNAPGITVTAHDTTLLGVLNLVSLESVAAAREHRGFAWGWVYLRERVSTPSHTWRALGGWVPEKRRNW
jgi:hypothetical protein